MATVTVPLDRITPPAPPARPWARLLAASLVAQPVLLGINALFHPEVELSGDSILAGAAEGPRSWYVVHVVAALGAAFGLPMALALRRLLPARRALADTAVGASILSAFLLSTSFMAEASAFQLFVESDISREAALTLADDYTGTPEFFAVGAGVLLAAVSAVLFGIALLRDRRVPRWQPAALMLGTFATFVAVPGTPLGPVGFAVVAVGGAGLARELLRRR